MHERETGMSAEIDAIERVGGRLCLDFVNTRSSHYASDAREYLHDYTDLLRWLRGCADGLSAAQAGPLAAQALAHPRLAAAAFAQARVLRDLLYRVFTNVARGTGPARGDVERLDGEVRHALAQRRLVPGANWHWSWIDPDALALPLWQALASSAQLLADDDLTRLKQCPAPDGCGWLFYDTSKNQTRRWCSMRMCGNGAKARRFQQRLRDAAP
jgi:predicted RNA-binding Zn ribbon-like protein